MDKFTEIKWNPNEFCVMAVKRLIPCRTSRYMENSSIEKTRERRGEWERTHTEWRVYFTISSFRIVCHCANHLLTEMLDTLTAAANLWHLCASSLWGKSDIGVGGGGGWERVYCNQYHTCQKYIQSPHNNHAQTVVQKRGMKRMSAIDGLCMTEYRGFRDEARGG